MAIEVRNIQPDFLSESEKNAFEILTQLPDGHFNHIKELMELDVPNVLGATTLKKFMEFAKSEGLDLSDKGIDAFKAKHKLGNTGVLKGLIGPQTAETFYEELTKPDEPAPAPAQPKSINAQGIALIKEFEGLHRKVSGMPGFVDAYLDPVNIPTIGYGSIKGVRMGDRITVARAEELLIEEVAEKAAAVDLLVKVTINENERAALVAFAYNVGVGALKNSTLLKRLNANLRDQAANEFMKWTVAKGKTLPGLVRRRQAERALFLKKP